MANDWIKMRMDLFTHPKTVRIMSGLKSDNLRTVGGLMSVWCLFDVHSDSGILGGYTKEMLDAHLRWEGFSDEMERVGWLNQTIVSGVESLELPDFSTHNGKSAKLRAEDSERKRLSRMSGKCPEKNGQKSDQRREEKRTEEKNKEEEKESPLDFAPNTQESKSPNGPRRPTIEQAVSAGSQFGITEEKAKSWWLSRESNGWIKSTAAGGTIPVGVNWQADLQTFSSRSGSFVAAVSATSRESAPRGNESSLQRRMRAMEINQAMAEIEAK